jgi:hypothetical protein
MAEKVKLVNIGTGVSAETKVVNTFIVKKIARFILMAKIAKTKTVNKGTEIPAETGMIKAVAEKKGVHTFTKTRMNQEKYIPKETEKGAIVEKEVTAENVTEKEV